VLSEADTRTIDACRGVLRALATAAKAEAFFGHAPERPMLSSEVWARGHFASLCASASGALDAVLGYADEYLDDVHTGAVRERQP
jgi:hypothetical protein